MSLAIRIIDYIVFALEVVCLSRFCGDDIKFTKGATGVFYAFHLMNFEIVFL